MARKNMLYSPILGNINLAAQADKTRLKSVMIELALQAQQLTKKDLKAWRNAHQQALGVENPTRLPLYNIYTDVDLDLHLSGCVEQRKGMVLKKSFKLTDAKGNENAEATELLEATWFKNLISHCLDARYWGHSLIQLGDVIVNEEGKPQFRDALLVPRIHVKPEFGVVVREPGDEPKKGFDYRNTPMSEWIIEAGESTDLGLFLKCAHQTIPKKNMLAFWDQFGELFGMPIRVGKTTTRDEKERSKLEHMLSEMGAAAWGLFPEGTEIDIKETSRGDAYNVYDKRIDRANAEISKGLLGQTMTIDNGSSHSQSEVHLEIFSNIVEKDADFLRDIINGQLLPRMIKHGFPVKGLKFWWDDATDYTPEQQVAFETMLLDRFEVDPAYFIEKYGVPITGKKEVTPITLSRPFFD